MPQQEQSLPRSRGPHQPDRDSAFLARCRCCLDFQNTRAGQIPPDAAFAILLGAGLSAWVAQARRATPIGCICVRFVEHCFRVSSFWLLCRGVEQEPHSRQRSPHCRFEALRVYCAALALKPSLLVTREPGQVCPLLPHDPGRSACSYVSETKSGMQRMGLKTTIGRFSLRRACGVSK